MDRRRLFPTITAVVVLGLSVVACEDTGTYSGQVARVTPTPRLPSARELAAVETAQAEGTREALQDAAKSTADALALQEQATKQVLNLNATREAQERNATKEAWAFAKTQEAVSAQSTVTAAAARERATATAESRIATATRQSIDTTATAAHDQATATAVQWAANVQGTKSAADAFAVEATRQAIERQSERERVTQPLRAWWVWVLLAVAIPALIWLGWRAAQVIEARARVIRRKADEGEPVIMMTRDRMALPLRSFNALMAGDEIPALPAPEMQDRATMRQQVSNAIQARQVGQIAEAKSKRPKVVNQNIALPAQTQASRKRRQIPGIVRVVSAGSLDEAKAAGILPPPLADAIEGQWEVIDGED